MSNDRPDDHELPDDPFPGDPFAAASSDETTAPAAGPSSGLPADDPLAALKNLGLGDLGNLGGLGGLGNLGGLGGMFNEVLRMAAAQGPLNWDAARQIAIWSAAQGEVEPTLDPIARIRLEELCRIAEPHVNEATGLVVSSRGITVVTHTRAAWAAQALQDHRPLLERLASSMANPAATADPGDPFAGLSQLLAPMMLSLQVGSLVGQLAQTSLATYDLPLPRPPGDTIGFVPVNIDGFASEWSIPLDTARMHVCLAELTTHAILAIPHVRALLSGLLADYAGAFRFEPGQVAEQLGGMGGFDPADPSSMEAMFRNPRALLGAIESPEQRAIRARIDVLVPTVVGYAEHIVAVTGARLLGDNRMVMEAWKRRRIEAGEGERMAGEMLGLTLDQDRYDLGVAFVGGVIQRSGSDGLAALWSDVAHLPTRAELDAPGLWLARIGLDTG